jgi:hypothetical protein
MTGMYRLTDIDRMTVRYELKKPSSRMTDRMTDKYRLSS